MQQQALFKESQKAVAKAVNVASVPQRSPFRYPGGKTWFIPWLRNWLKHFSQRPSLLVEPFSGGGIVSLTAAAEKLTDRVYMSELDADVAAVWESVTDGKAEDLARRILEFDLTKENVLAELSQPSDVTVERAFQTILRNRASHGGIMANGSGLIKNGESGKGICSRWYPDTLARRFREIDRIRDRIFFERADAFSVLERFREDPDAVFFIDPPYTAGGKRAGSRLYRHFELNHEELFRACCSLRGDFIMTYDNAMEVRGLARRFGLQYAPIPMKNTHHAAMTELVVGRDLSWMNRIDNQA
ncbi:MAG: DNA adenine methylase [Candidatus Dadabacteria bacterium]|nr:DNA adenine methylase [Candidatus Dadabacteria bacterium]